MIAAFCERLFWTDYSVLMQRINEKLSWAVKEELLDLMQLPSLKPERARCLYISGIQAVKDILNYDPDQLVRIFNKHESFQSHRKDDQARTIDLEMRYGYLKQFSQRIYQEASIWVTKNKDKLDGEE